MRNLEGIRLIEVEESELEKKSIGISDENINYGGTKKIPNGQDDTLSEEDMNFDDCFLTEEKWKENDSEEEIDFDDCFLTEEERLEILKNELSKKPISEEIETYDECVKLGK